MQRVRSRRIDRDISMGFGRFHCLVILQLCVIVLTAGGNETPARKKVAVEGVVYCKLCTRDPNNGFHIETQLSPLGGAVVKLQCNNTIRSWEEAATTQGNGSFLIMPQKVSTWGVHKCKLFLVSSPRNDCFLPRRGDGPWNLGYPLTAAASNSSSATIQYFTAAAPLLYYYYWPDCS